MLPCQTMATVWRPVLPGLGMRDPRLGQVMSLHGLDPGPVVGPHDVDEGDGAAPQHEQEEAEEGGEELHTIVPS